MNIQEEIIKNLKERGYKVSRRKFDGYKGLTKDRSTFIFVSEDGEMRYGKSVEDSQKIAKFGG